MKKILTIALAASVVMAANAQIVKSYEKPSDKELKTAVKTVLKSTTCFDADATPRIEAMNVIQRAMNNFSNEDYHNFRRCYGRREAQRNSQVV